MAVSPVSGKAATDNTADDKHATFTNSLLASDWLERREKVVQRAIDDDDRDKLREVAALPGGSGSNEMRQRVWPMLLRTERYAGDAVSNGPEPTQESWDQDDLHFEDVNTPGVTGEASSIASAEDWTQLSELFTPHPDESQVLLDTKRSFVSYPKGLPAESKQILQDDLQDLIVGVLRKFPALHYFQGYHDILSVLYLTYIPLPAPTARSRSTSREGRRRKVSGLTAAEKPSEASEESGSAAQERQEEKAIHSDRRQRAGFSSSVRDSRPSDHKTGKSRDTHEWRQLRQCAVIISLCRVRDAMGIGMEGMMGYLKILKRLLRVADPELAAISANISPVPTLPFFALSWILCLFSHDVDTLEPIQRMFDYLLSRNPISAIYLAVAILISKKPQMLDLAQKLGPEAMDDPSLLHPLFARLPPLFPDTPSETAPPEVCSNITANAIKEDEANPYEPIPLSRIFALADELIERFPWDGADVQSHNIMGGGSVVWTYEQETNVDWSLSKAMSHLDKDVVLPGSGMMDEESDEEKEEEVPQPARDRRLRLHLPRDKLGTAIAVGVVLAGIGISVIGIRSGGSRAGWAGWWSLVIRSWAYKGGELGFGLGGMLNGWRELRHLAVRVLREL